MHFGKRSRELEIKFDPDKQYAIIRSSICTGEKVAGFKNKEDGPFTEVMLIRSYEDELRFKELYNLETRLEEVELNPDLWRPLAWEKIYLK